MAQRALKAHTSNRTPPTPRRLTWTGAARSPTAYVGTKTTGEAQQSLSSHRHRTLFPLFAHFTLFYTAVSLDSYIRPPLDRTRGKRIIKFVPADNQSGITRQYLTYLRVEKGLRPLTCEAYQRDLDGDPCWPAAAGAAGAARPRCASRWPASPRWRWPMSAAVSCSKSSCTGGSYDALVVLGCPGDPGGDGGP